MPTVNIFYKNLDNQKDLGRQLSLDSVRDELKSFIAKELTCKDRELKPEEISIRLIDVDGDGMLGAVELEVTAHAYKERVEKQDQICLNIAKFLKDKGPSFSETKVWLILTELGHSLE